MVTPRNDVCAPIALKCMQDVKKQINVLDVFKAKKGVEETNETISAKFAHTYSENGFANNDFH